MPEMRISSEITPADMNAAFKFIDKRVRRHNDDVLEGVGSALFSVMMTTGECLTECGLPVSEVERMFDQFKAQVVFQLNIPSHFQSK